MQRVGFLFKIKPEYKDEYKKAHDEIWPEQLQALKESGLNNYSSYYMDGNVFTYAETENFENSVNELFKKEINEKWQEHMEKYFVKSNPSKLGPEIVMLEEIFHMD